MRIISTMSQALLLSDNQIINDILTVNLLAYVDTNLTIKSNLEEASQLIKLNPNFNYVISLSNLANESSARLLHDFMVEQDITVPMIVLGSGDHFPEDVTIVQNIFDIKMIIRTAAKIMEITAKDMSKKQVPDFFPVPLGIIANIKQTNCDIYFKKSTNRMEHDYIQIMASGAKINEDILKYKERGVDTLYVPSSERLFFINAASTSLLERLTSEETTPAGRTKAISEGLQIISTLINNNNPEVTEEINAISKACIASIQKTVAENPKLSKLLKLLKESSDGYVYQHSILTNYIAGHILDGMSWGSPEQKEKLSFVLFYHDIFLLPIFEKYPHLSNEEEILFDDEVSEDDKESAIVHARKAGELIRSMKIPPIGADTIAVQHHGSTKGEGFTEIPSENISPLAKVVIVAEGFLQEYMSVTDGNSNVSFNIRASIDCLNKKFKRASYKKIIDKLIDIKI